MRCCTTATEKQVVPRTLTSPFSPAKITAHKLIHRELHAQALWTHTMQDAGVISPSLCTKVDAAELLKQSQALSVSRARLWEARLSRHWGILIPQINVVSGTWDGYMMGSGYTAVG